MMVDNTEYNDRQLSLMSVYNDDLKRLERRIGKDRSASTWRALLQGRDYVQTFLRDHLQSDDIPLEKVAPQFIHDFSTYLSEF